MGAFKLTQEEAMELSKPYLSGFNPYVIPYQGELFNLVRRDWDYSQGNLEILLSGSFGSAKSIAMAHLAITHCLLFDRARVCLARRSMPDLKDTIFKEVIEHLELDPFMEEGVDYWVTANRGYILFSNGSEIISRSWADKKYNKGRSLKLSMLIFEEIVENNEEDMQAFKTLKARLRRLPHVPENVLIAATNPDEPDHWVYRYWMIDTMPFKFVFYSITDDNPFLDPIYVEQQRATYSPQEIERYLRGKWLSLKGKGIYYNYDSDRNFLPDQEYEFKDGYPISIMHDFNIGNGKPMSAAIGQHIDGVFHVAKTFIIEGMSTPQLMDEMANDGVFEKRNVFYIYGDVNGSNRNTAGSKTDYEIIKKFIGDYKRKDGSAPEFEMCLPKKNPLIRQRHNHMNGVFLNDLGKVRFLIYKSAKGADEGFRLTKFKKGADLIEDDSFKFQHVTTAIGYWCDYVIRNDSVNSIVTMS